MKDREEENLLTRFLFTDELERKHGSYEER